MKTQMKMVDKLNKAEVARIETIMMRDITKVITSHPHSAEAATAALSSLVQCAYILAKRMWGVDAALKAIKFALEFEAQKDKGGS